MWNIRHQDPKCEHCESNMVNYVWEDENDKWKPVEVYECEDCGEHTYFLI